VEKMSILAQVGKISSYVALAFGTFFFIFAIKYYVAILLALFGGRNVSIKSDSTQNSHRLFTRINKRFFRNDKRDTNWMEEDWFSYHDNLHGESPFVSIHLPFYNEKNVARRIIDACSAIDYKNFEILVLDDSRDETIEVLKELSRRKGPPTIKVIHRKDRRGFKGGALSEGVRHMDPRTEYIVVFDADFIPQPDIMKQFIWYFKTQNLNIANENGDRYEFTNYTLSNPDNKQNVGLDDESNEKRIEEGYQKRKIAAVQGYQRHHLNKSENWITRGVRAEYSGSYMIERPAEEFFDALKMISGSVFMIRADVVKQLGWTTSITEDWDLTLRLYLAGYKVIYTPLVQAPAEIPTTIRRLAQQRMRWAEGAGVPLLCPLLSTILPLPDGLNMLDDRGVLPPVPSFLDCYSGLVSNTEQPLFTAIDEPRWAILGAERRRRLYWHFILHRSQLCSGALPGIRCIKRLNGEEGRDMDQDSEDRNHHR